MAMVDTYENMRKHEDELVNQQVMECLALIELERSAFIRVEYGRLQAVMGTEYVGPDGKTILFHGDKNNDINLEGEVPGDPYELSLDELVAMTGYQKRIERIGTWSYMKFFHNTPEDMERLKLLRDMWDKLMNHQPCTEDEVKRLKSGHEAYLKYKTDDDVQVIE